MKVLLADGNTRAALALARSLGDAGHTVHVAAPKRHSLAGMSRHCAGEFLQPGADAAPEEIAASLAATAADCGAERVAAMTDRTLTGLHLASPGLPAAVLPTPSAEHYLTASDKAWLFERSAEWGIAVPMARLSKAARCPTASCSNVTAPIGCCDRRSPGVGTASVGSTARYARSAAGRN